MTPDDAATAETPAPPLTRREMRALRESGVLPVVGAETATVVAAACLAAFWTASTQQKYAAASTSCS